MRILLMNVLIVFVPVVVLLLLGTYETQLLNLLERNLVQQGRMLAASLPRDGALGEERAREVLSALGGRHESRIRILDADGLLLADTSALGTPVSGGTAEVGAASLPETTGPRERVLYRVASAPVRWLRSLAGDPGPPLESADFYTGTDYSAGSEVRAALEGRYGAATRVSTGGQISVTLYSAIPVQTERGVAGAVLVSQSTYRILQDLYALRLDVFAVFLVSLAVAIVLSVFLSVTIARPIARLRSEAQSVVDRHGRLTAPIRPSARRDEVGALSRALSELTEQIESHTRGLESFAADVAHELKNPLASIRASCELAGKAAEPAVRSRFLDQAVADVQRCQRIIEAIRELSHIDAGADAVEFSRPEEPLREAAAWCATTYPDYPVKLEIAPEAAHATVRLGAARLRQVVENLLDNAVSFSPPAAPVAVRVALKVQPGGTQLRLCVEDRGSGLPAGDEERVFTRFYSSRTSRDGHLGLGLAIVRSLAEQAGGSVHAENRSGGGARLVVTLPVTPGS
jgi:two-component system sensor histidine kinase ChvG